MSDPKILVCGPAIDLEESAERLEALRQITLPNVAKFVVTTGKFDTQKMARAFNIDADYPAAPAHLQTLSREADASDLEDPRFRDGYDIFCLRRILTRHDEFEFAVLLRDGDRFQDRWPELRSSLNGELFLTFGLRQSESPEPKAVPNLLVDLKDKRATAFLDRVGGFYMSGAAYAMTNYSLDAALNPSLQSLRLEELMAESRQQAAHISSGPQGAWFGGSRTSLSPSVRSAAFER